MDRSLAPKSEAGSKEQEQVRLYRRIDEGDGSCDHAENKPSNIHTPPANVVSIFG